VFPPGAAGNVFRGALGLLLRQVVCDPNCAEARTCARATECAYARAFEPRQLARGPSGLADLPRPFALRAASLDNRRIAAGEAFALDMHLFDLAPGLAELFGEAFGKLEWEGLGPRRPGVALERIESSDAIVIDLDAERTATQLTLHFVTPTEIKSEGTILREPRFDAVFARARDRVSQLADLYQQPLPLDFKGLGERSRRARLVDANLEHHRTERRSSRTGQSHALAGFTGVATYEGDLGEFLPILQAAQWCGIGRHTVWGMGAFQIEGIET
jgi:hypothetical protein